MQRAPIAGGLGQLGSLNDPGSAGRAGWNSCEWERSLEASLMAESRSSAAVVRRSDRRDHHGSNVGHAEANPGRGVGPGAWSAAALLVIVHRSSNRTCR